MLSHYFSAEISERFQFTRLKCRNLKSERRVVQVAGNPVLIRRLSSETVVVEEKLHFIAIAEHPDVERRFFSPVARNECHRARVFRGIALGLIEVVTELRQSKNIRHPGSFEIFRIAAVVVEHHPQAIASGLSAEVFVMGFLKIRRLLEQADFAISALLAGVAFFFFKIRPSVLIQSGVARIVFPVAILGDDRGESDVLEFLGAAVLPCHAFHIESFHPASS